MKRWLAALSFVAPAALAGEVARADGQEPRSPPSHESTALAGVRDGVFYLRALDDRLRIYPAAALRLDATWSPGHLDLPAAFAADKSGPRLFVRRLRLEMTAEILAKLSVTAGIEMGGQRVGQTRFIGATTPRWMPADVSDGKVRPSEVSISVMPWHELSFTVGRVYAPFSLANRTPEAATPFMEQPIAVRGLSVPDDRVFGVMAWGEATNRVFAYEGGIFTGNDDAALGVGNVDAIGRMFVRPLALTRKGVFFELAQLGLSARYGYRDPSRVTTDYPTFASGSGYVLWQPGYVDDQGRVVRVMPSGAQRSLGGELRLPIRTPTHAVFDLRAEAYYIRNGTREAESGFEAASPLRSGTLEGVGWYTSLAWWACFIPGFEQLVTGEPGIIRPRSLSDSRGPSFAHGFEASVLAGGVRATYSGASRSGTPSPTPVGTEINVYQLGAAVQYWLGVNVRVTFNYMAYFAPPASTGETSAVVLPGDLAHAPGVQTDHVLHELGLRLGGTL